MNKRLLSKKVKVSFITEAEKAKGLGETEKVQKESGKFNKEGLEDGYTKLSDLYKFDEGEDDAMKVERAGEGRGGGRFIHMEEIDFPLSCLALPLRASLSCLLAIFRSLPGAARSLRRTTRPGSHNSTSSSSS